MPDRRNRLAAVLRPETAVVSIMYANNEVGTVQPVARLASLARAQGIPFHTDAVQAAGWLPLFGLAIVSQILGQGLIAYAFAHLPASLSSVSLLIQPVVAALAAWMIFAEPVGPMQFAGGAIVLAGIWLARKGSL